MKTYNFKTKLSNMYRYKKEKEQIYKLVKIPYVWNFFKDDLRVFQIFHWLHVWSKLHMMIFFYFFLFFFLIYLISSKQHMIHISLEPTNIWNRKYISRPDVSNAAVATETKLIQLETILQHVLLAHLKSDIWYLPSFVLLSLQYL